MEEIALALRA